MVITSIRQLKNSFYGRDLIAIRPILNYYSGIKSAVVDIDHDGCDGSGWESNLVKIIITAKINGQMRMQEWYYEDWFEDKNPVAAMVKDVAI